MSLLRFGPLLGLGAAACLLSSAVLLPTSTAGFTSVQTNAQNSWAAGQRFRPPTVDLGSAAAYSVLAWTDVSNSGKTVLSEALGVSPGATVVGFPPGVARGGMHLAGPGAAEAQADLMRAYDKARALAPTDTFSGDQNAVTFTPGVHFTGAAFALTGTMTLDGQGDPNASFIFQIDAAMDTAAASRMVLVGGARATNIFFLVTGAAGTGAASHVEGTIIAVGAITVGAGAVVHGRVLSRGKITLSSNTITTS